MEMPEQNLPHVFSHMLQMFPNIPHDVVWLYVERYSSDIEKCAQMLNLQNGKYTAFKSSSNLDICENLNESNQTLHTKPPPKIVLENNNEISVTEELPLRNSEAKNITKEGVNDNQLSDYSALSSQSFHPSPHFSPHIVHGSGFPMDSSSNYNSVHFHEPLALHINVDNDDGSLHSWRPNMSADVLCSDFFLTSHNQVSNLNFQRDRSEIEINPEDGKQNPCRYTTTPMHISYNYPLQSKMPYGIDIASHLHYQKSQMNAMRYEVIKAKIDLGDLKESVEKLSFELKEKMESKSAQDIEKLNKEIVKLRLECQCLCTEVDCSSIKDQVLLGDVDERFYEKSKSSSNNTESQNPVRDHSTHSHSENSSDGHGEWQCPKCTFANHPAINVCEMCHVPKPATRSPPFLAAAPSSCYCHPKEESLFVQS